MNTTNNSPDGQSFDLNETISRYTKHRKWFLFSVLIFVALAFLYLRYAIPEYMAEAKIQIVADQAAGPGLDLFKELNVFSGGGNAGVEDEIELIKSRSNFIDVVKELGLNSQIHVRGSIRDTELYSNPPIKINLIAHDSIINRASLEFFISLSSSTTFGYAEAEDMPEKVYAFGKSIPSPVGNIVITPNLISFEDYLNKKLKVVIQPVPLIAQYYRNLVGVSAGSPTSNILYIALQDPIKERSRDIINTLINTYNRKAIEDKQIIADRTSNFINDRINDISSSLSSVDQTAEDFKSGRGLTDIASEANINLNVGASNQQNLANIRTQYNIASSMKDIVEQQEGFDVLPSNIGLADATIANATSKYNELVLERKRLLESSNEKNPVIVNLDQQITGIKRSMESSLNSAVNNLELQVNNLSGQQAIINSKIYSAPRNERGLRDITRKQETTEQLYLYLLQKREEAQIAVASTSPKSKVIDYAYNAMEFPVSPKKSLVFLTSLILGFFVPFSIIYAKTLLDNKVHNMHTLEKLTRNIPVLGELPRLSKKEDKMLVSEDRSVLAESLRIIRTNLDYLIKTKVTNIGDRKNNVVYVTSSVPGEGKTFLSTNLALVLSSTGKKVVLLGADIRNPKLYSFFMGDQIDKMSRSSRNKDMGLTEYLYDETIETRDIINPMLVHRNTIDVIYSGRIPPNPAELLMSNRLKKLVKEVSEMYDYVIVDTAPMLVVSDTLLISEYADHLIYVTRAGITEKKAIEFPLKLQEEGKIKGLAFVVNDVVTSNLGYGGKYGYGYGKTIKKWWKL